VSYSEITTRDPNPLKRWLQNRRLDDALRAVGTVVAGSGGVSLLDFGGGDGLLAKRFKAEFPGAVTYCYEPSVSLRSEAQQSLAGHDVEVIADTRGLGPGSISVLTCCEVFEHLPPEETSQAIREIVRLLEGEEGGHLIIGVPNEIYAVGFVKGLFRMFRRYGEYDARWDTVISAAKGRPSRVRPIHDIDGMPFIYPHTGFDHRSLVRELESHGITVEALHGSPLRQLPLGVNSEIYLVCRVGSHRPSTRRADAR
jgi:SAM-dependent methyltransferase